MENTTPSFTLGYWRPWQDNSSFVDSWCEYLKDTSLARYSADLIGKQVHESNRNLAYAMREIADEISYQINDVSYELKELNQRLDLSLEQQRLSNFVLSDISELLKIPNSEKERQKAISLGIKFMIQAQKDNDLFEDALIEFLKAEAIMPQDYFVLNRLGYIYLYSPNHIDFKKASDYFIKAAKYAAVEDSSDLQRLAIAFTHKGENQRQTNANEILANSYEKAALAQYCMSNDASAIEYQLRAISMNNTPFRQFTYAKYLFRSGNFEDGCTCIKKAIISNPILYDAVIADPDFQINNSIVTVTNELKQEIDNKYEDLISFLNRFSDNEANKIRQNIVNSINNPIPRKYSDYLDFVSCINDYEAQKAQLNAERDAIIKKADEIIESFNNHSLRLIRDNIQQESYIHALQRLRNIDIFNLKKEFESIQNQIYRDSLHVGIKYEGGIIAWINEKGTGGIICAEKDLVQKARWCSHKYPTLPCKSIIGNGQFNTNYIFKSLSHKKDSAAYLCKSANINDYNDWFLPSKEEILILSPYLTKESTFWTSSFEDDCPLCLQMRSSYPQIMKANIDDKYNIRPIRTFGDYKLSSTKCEIVKNEDYNGCYIATCVYGSYDCPEVWTLRRFRDYTLDDTWYGRLFINIYYAISPTIVKWYGENKSFKAFWKKLLDKLISQLRDKGISSLPYSDKY